MNYSWLNGTSQKGYRFTIIDNHLSKSPKTSDHLRSSWVRCAETSPQAPAQLQHPSRLRAKVGWYCIINYYPLLSINDNIFHYICLVVYLPLWKIWVRQLGWWNSQIKIMFQTTKQLSIFKGHLMDIWWVPWGTRIKMIKTVCGTLPGLNRNMVCVLWCVFHIVSLQKGFFMLVDHGMPGEWSLSHSIRIISQLNI